MSSATSSFPGASIHWALANSSWGAHGHLPLGPAKIRLISPTFSISGAGYSVLPGPGIRTLGVTFDSSSLTSCLPTNLGALPSAFTENPPTSCPLYCYCHGPPRHVGCLDDHDSLFTGPLFLTLLPESVLYTAARTILVDYNVGGARPVMEMLQWSPPCSERTQVL